MLAENYIFVWLGLALVLTVFAYWDTITSKLAKKVKLNKGGRPVGAKDDQTYAELVNASQLLCFYDL